jgi:hypothetical protein
MQGTVRPGSTLNPGHPPPARRVQDAIGPQH